MLLRSYYAGFVIDTDGMPRWSAKLQMWILWCCSGSETSQVDEW